MPDKTEKKQGRFVKGQSGNPNGRPKGSLGKSALIAQQLVSGATEQIVGTVIDKAMDGEPWACKMVLDRILPVGTACLVEQQEYMPEMANKKIEELRHAFQHYAKEFEP